MFNSNDSVLNHNCDKCGNMLTISTKQSNKHFIDKIRYLESTIDKLLLEISELRANLDIVNKNTYSVIGKDNLYKVWDVATKKFNNVKLDANLIDDLDKYDECFISSD